jgi:NADPH-dependent curcumin reductase CurA
MVIAKKFIYASRFHGEPKLDNFRLEEEDLPALQDGGNYWHEIIIKNKYWIFHMMQLINFRLFLNRCSS